MPIMMRLDWSGVTPEQYDEVRRVVGWESNVPGGAIAHVAAFDDAGLHVVDMWESVDTWDAFQRDRLAAGLAQVGIPGEPTVSVLTAHAVFVPAAAAPAVRTPTKRTVKKTTKRTPAKKTAKKAAKKRAVKRTAAKKTAKRAPAKKAPARRPAVKKTAKKTPAKTTTKKTAARKTAKRAPAKKTARR